MSKNHQKQPKRPLFYILLGSRELWVTGSSGASQVATSSAGLRLGTRPLASERSIGRVLRTVDKNFGAFFFGGGGGEGGHVWGQVWYLSKMSGEDLGTLNLKQPSCLNSSETFRFPSHDLDLPLQHLIAKIPCGRASRPCDFTTNYRRGLNNRQYCGPRILTWLWSHIPQIDLCMILVIIRTLAF